MIPVACSLHPMDVRVLKQIVSAIQGGTIPDMTAEAASRAHRDILLNWSRRVIRAAATLAELVPRERWMLYTQMRPYFVTADDPELAVDLTERLFEASDLEDVLNLFRQEVARIDPDQADAVIETARQDPTPSMFPQQAQENLARHFRAHLLFERREIEALASEVESGKMTPERLREAGKMLAWRTCQLLANLHPSWFIRNSSLTALASRKDLGMTPLVADPRGMYAAITQRVTGLQAAIPYRLSANSQTGVCITPKSVSAVLDTMTTWPNPVLADPEFGVPTPGEVLALREALIYAKRHEAGLWEATDLYVPDKDIIPLIMDDSGKPGETPVIPEHQTPLAITTPLERPASESDETPEPDTPKSWFQKLLKR